MDAFAAGAILTMLADTMMPEAFAYGGKLGRPADDVRLRPRGRHRRLGARRLGAGCEVRAAWSASGTSRMEPARRRLMSVERYISSGMGMGMSRLVAARFWSSVSSDRGLLRENRVRTNWEPTCLQPATSEIVGHCAVRGLLGLTADGTRNGERKVAGMKEARIAAALLALAAIASVLATAERGNNAREERLNRVRRRASTRTLSAVHDSPRRVGAKADYARSCRREKP